MSLLKRAKTWEISDSEAESDCEIKQLKSDSVCNDQITPFFLGAGGNKLDQIVTCSEGSEALPNPAAGDPSAVHAPLPIGATSSSPGKKRRRTKEEIELEKRIAEERKETREKSRRKKVQEKDEKKREQMHRKEAADRIKMYRPDNCLKCLTVCVDPALLQDEGSDTLLGTLCAMEWKSSIEEQQLTQSITWKRVLPEKEYGPDVVQEEQTIMVLRLHEFLDMVYDIKQNHQHGPEVKSLYRDLSQYLSKHKDKRVSLAVIGISSWDFWKGEYRGKTSTSEKALRLFDMEQALVVLQLDKNTSVIFLENWQELADHVCAVMRALSKRPLRRLTEAPDLPFCVDGPWACGARVKRDGTGLRQVWSRQMEQLNRVSPRVAAVMATSFPSPQLLVQAYKDSASEEARKGLLADLRVVCGDRERRVGPDISCRVYRFLTTQNPQLVLD